MALRGWARRVSRWARGRVAGGSSNCWWNTPGHCFAARCGSSRRFRADEVSPGTLLATYRWRSRAERYMGDLMSAAAPALSPPPRSDAPNDSNSNTADVAPRP